MEKYLAAVVCTLFALLQSGLCFNYIPLGFYCDKYAPMQKNVYSNPGPNQRMVDLIHLLCGQVTCDAAYNCVAEGFHAMPTGITPDSVALQLYGGLTGPNDIRMVKTAHNPFIYSTLIIQNEFEYGFVEKNGISTIWPTMWTSEQLLWVISYLELQYRNVLDPYGAKKLCISQVTTAAGYSFDVIMLYGRWNGYTVIKTAYPAASAGKCSRVDPTEYHVVQFMGWP